jgi:hypothetical protein
MVKKGKRRNDITLVKYKATLENDSWTNVTALPFDSNITILVIPH